MKNKPEAIIFDLDGTLVDSARDLSMALNHVLRKAGRDIFPIAKLRNTVGEGARAMITKGFSATGSLPDEHEIELILEDFLEYYQNNIAEQTIAFPGAIRVLNRLRHMDIPLGICTNKSLKLSKKLLDEMDLSPYFKAISCGDSFNYRKPDPLHLHKTLEMMDCSKEGAVMVGDSASDIHAAKALNIPVIAVSFGYTATPVSQLPADKVIDHFDHFFEALSALSY